MTLRTRKRFIAPIVATVAAIGALSAVAQAAPTTTATAIANTEPPSAVEDFNYPGADRILAEQDLKLGKGDGGILLTECTADSWNIKVAAIKNWATSEHCFKTPGKTGYLSLEVTGTFSIQTADRSVRATLTSEGKKKTVDAPKGLVTPVGAGDIPGGGKDATLVELRVTG
ncbi:hypothetical protein [Streptomyces sp. TLI_146]|uniref:hypothetical protein n=1 Tax=Streptomyces sp. TLI_146 TaxID=1938858 RepID=UPI000C705100|nr:hypothetical protein [Streptomyces sp. TLI_146]PKV82815.1 hypothetical protein BX283_0276 [Streptomyces sp. TLI_146]